jgi:hypothetical protein
LCDAEDFRSSVLFDLTSKLVSTDHLHYDQLAAAGASNLVPQIVNILITFQDGEQYHRESKQHAGSVQILPAASPVPIYCWQSSATLFS